MSAASRLGAVFGRRSHGIGRLAAPVLCFAALLFGARSAGAQFRLWGTEIPGIGKTKLGLGLGYLSERQKSLTISSASGTVTVRDLLTGATDTVPLDRDPGLLNRKFDLEWSMSGPFLEVPITLPGFQAAGRASIEPTLTFRVMEEDFDLRFLNRPETGADDSLHGRGPVFGAGLEVAGILCVGCPWFAAAGYRFQTLQNAEAQGTQAILVPGGRVLGDEIRLSRRTHDAFTRAGYAFSGGRILSYVGVRRRWAEVDIKDELRLHNTVFDQETTLRTRTRLESRATEGIIGLEARLSGSVSGRTEITFNGEDYGVLARVVYSGPFRRTDPVRVRAAAIAVAIAGGLQRVADEFFQGREHLRVIEGPGGSAAYLASDLKDLLDRTERELSKVLEPYPELLALGDWAHYRFQQVRQDLRLGPANVLASLASLAAVRLLQKPEPETRDRSSAFGSLGDLGNRCLLFLVKLAKEDQLLMELTFISDQGSGIQLKIYPPYQPNPNAHSITVSAGNKRRITRGLYSFQVYRKGPNRRDPDQILLECDYLQSTSLDSPCPFDLVLDPRPELLCDKTSCSQKDLPGGDIR